jgi:hypothetical protein
MAKQTEERKTAMRNLVRMLAGTLALGYLTLAAIGNPAAAQGPGGKGDTPVVLVGGSFDFKAGNMTTGDGWKPKTPNKDYFYSANNPLKVIALKTSYTKDGTPPDADDSNSATDHTRISISNPTSWQVQLYTEESASTSVAHLEPQGNDIHIIVDSATGALCFTANQLIFQPSGDCKAKDKTKFSQINIIVGGQQVASLSCLVNGKKNKCRFVLRTQELPTASLSK